MRSFEPHTVSRWATELARRGYSLNHLAAGVEGVVFRLGNGAVAKVWKSRTQPETERLASFYGAVARAGLPFRTPEIFEVGHLSDATFSIERELPGTPLFADHTGESPPLEPGKLKCLADVLGALAAVEPTEEMKQLPVLDEPALLWSDGRFNDVLAQLVTLRVERGIGQMKAAITNADELASAVVGRLSSMPAGSDGLVHGDLIPANILVDGDGRVAAVLDFGSLSTAGAPAFDAAIATNIFDMYGPRKEASRTAIEQMVHAAFGYPHDVLAVYLAAYALATTNLFGSSEKEGHFHWCAEVLRRPAVVETLTSV